MKKKTRYIVVWEDCRKNTDVARRFFVPGYRGHLPFFLGEAEVEAFEKKEKVELREEHLLKGILCGLYEFDHYPTSVHQRGDRKTLLYLLNVLRNGFEFKSIEEMIIDVALDIREQDGNDVSRVILEVGSELVPRSSKIKSELICDLWATASGDDFKFLERIIALVAQIDLNDVYPGAREVIRYYGFCATVILNRRHYVTSNLERYIYPEITKPGLRQRITALLENPEKCNLEDLRVI
ncbi:MAG: hypothetical protein C4576_30555 [Desulfobacteraceae bacterium]|nr:MAG: hypothetical protein C4576_30555 [Desulfobacteraceae bacterium]